jgi:hypothetical protein
LVVSSKHARATAALVTCLATFSGCGSPSSTPGVGDATPSNSSVQPTTPADVEAINQSTVPAIDELVVRVGGVDFALPPDWKPYPRLEPPKFPEVLETSHWADPTSKSLRLTLQSVEPNFGDKPHSTVESAGLQWTLYDAGAANGSEVVGVARVSDGWIVVVLFQNNFDPTDAGWSELTEILNTAKV